MAWMIGTNGQTTMPKCRLDLGHKPSYNIKYKEVTHNNGGMPFFDPQYGTGWSSNTPMPYGNYYNNCNNGFETTMGIIAGLGALTAGIIGVAKGSKEVAKPETNPTSEAFTQIQQQTNEQIAEMNKKLQAVVAENQKLKVASQEYQQGQVVQNALAEGKDLSMVSEEWTAKNNKENITNEEMLELFLDYQNNIAENATSWLGTVDKSFGDNNGKMTLEEFTNYLIKTKLGENPSDSDKAKLTEDAKLAFSRLNINGNNEISSSEIAAALFYLDGTDTPDGKIEGQDFKQFAQDLTAKDDNISEKLKDSFNTFFGEE